MSTEVKEREEDLDLMMIDDDEGDALSNKYMLFKIADEVYGIEIRFVTEIIELQKITEVPDLPDYIKGVINLRGRVIPVMDVRLRFKMQPREYDDRTCIIIVRTHETSIGFVVDTVAEVQSISESNMEEAPKFSNSTKKEQYIKSLGKVDGDVKILLDVEKIIFQDELSVIEKNINQEN